MVEKFRNYIERGSWEEDLEGQFARLKVFCWVVIVLAALYFGGGYLQRLLVEVIQ
ncbi:MAG TPA: hypothetical protein P5244_08230 [Syntrophales bacterium]|nr:hypothetical protein [Syntrophales bacterium]